MKHVRSDRVSRRSSWWRTIGPVLCVGGAVLISGCSTLEDMGESTADGISTAANAMNPFNWFGDDEGEATPAQQKQDATASAPGKASQSDPNKYPKLTTVPGRPKQAISSQAKRDRQALRDGLVADTKNAQYSDRDLRAQQAAPPPAPAIAPPVNQPDAVRANERIAPPAASVAAPVPTSPTPQVAGGGSIPRVQPPQSPQTLRQARSAPQSTAQAAPQAAPQTAPQPAPVVPRSPAAAVNVPPAQPRVGLPGQTVAPQVATRAPAPPAPRRVLKTVQVATIYFNNGSSSLSRSDRRVVDQVAQIVRRTGGRVRVIGHSSVGGRMSDATQREDINYQTSLQRAKSVALELSRLGIPNNRIQVSAEGDRSPIYAESSATGAAGNRRTEIYLDYVEGT